MKALALALILALGPGPLGAASTLQVLCYHRFAPDCGKDPYCVTDDELKAQLDWLKAGGWQSVGLSQVARALDGGEALPAKAVMLSVDDGYKAGVRGALAFERAGYRGVFFINPGSLASPRRAAQSAFVTAADLRDLELRGHSIGSHGMTHANLAKVPEGMAPQAYRAWLHKELAGSRKRLEEVLGRAVTDLAWPFGAYNQAVIEAARRAGYRQLYTVTDASTTVPGADRLRLPRFLLMRPFSLASFQRRIDAASAPTVLDGIEDGQVTYDEGTRGFRFIQGELDGRPARILVQRARPQWRDHFEGLLTPAESGSDHAP
jgi:peptidoglycan/xylan/chitin deacetylase (PgdA/CDA1 family)